MSNPLKNFSVLFALFIVALGYAQDGYNPDALAPTSPTAFQFLKYTDFPVSEYTGIPDISIPIFKVQEKDFDLNLELKYHAMGIKVNQEASEVGLGWSLSVGSIVQVIQDVDDYSPVRQQLRPDWSGYPSLSEYPLRYQYPTSADGFSWTPTQPVISPQKYHTAKIATDYYMPVNGNFQRFQSFFEQANHHDSEPDIFKANFSGHSLTFLKRFGQNSEQIIVLDKVGYKVNRVVPSSGIPYWTIITPGGIQYEFKILEEVSTHSHSKNQWSINSGLAYNHKITEKIYHLSKITSFNYGEINFEYETQLNVNSFPKFNQKLIKITNSGYVSVDGAGHNLITGINTSYGSYPTSNQQFIVDSYMFSSSNKKYLKKINFSAGKIDFTYSSRLDSPELKLDKTIISDYNGKPIKEIKFNYDYFISSITGNQYSAASIPVASYNTHRLRLKSMLIDYEKFFQFNYNNAQLPRKLSYAVDYWGFYNGRLNDNSIVPDPSRYPNTSGFIATGNNKSSKIEYTKTGILEEIIYPTKGKTVFEYEANNFSNYFVPDYNSTSNTSTSGYGLRIKSISKYLENGDLALKNVYEYGGGKAILPSTTLSTYNTRWLNWMNPSMGPNSYRGYDNLAVKEFKPLGYFTSNLLGSHSGVGYDKVTIKNIDVSNGLAQLGKTEIFFHNNPDIITPGLPISGYFNISLPAFVASNVPINGQKKEIKIFNSAAEIIKTENFNYQILESELFYGARIANVGYTLVQLLQYGGTSSWVISRDLIGFYPFFGKRSNLQSHLVTEYFENSNINFSKYYIYNSYDLPIQITESSSQYSSKVWKYKYPTNGHSLFTRNKINAVTEIEEGRSSSTFSKRNSTSFQLFNNLILPSNRYYYKFNYPESTITFVNYDSQGNLLEYKKPGGISTSLIWGYNKNYPIARVEGATPSQVEGWFMSFTGKNLEYLSTLSNADIDNNSEETLRIWLGKLRQAVYQYGEGFEKVSTFTHDPLVGVTSITEPNGESTYFNFDHERRLKNIKDSQNFLIQEYEYHYKN